MVSKSITHALSDVTFERNRQQVEEGYDKFSDDVYVNDELALAAATYALPERFRKNIHKAGDDDPCPTTWPWEAIFFKPGDRRSELVKAAALLLAEIERIDRCS